MKPTRDTLLRKQAGQTLPIRASAESSACNYQRGKWKWRPGLAPVLFRRPRNFTFHPFHSRPASATTAFYPICQRYKLILISGLAHAGFLGREGWVGFIGIRVTRCDVIVARSTGAPTINAVANRASEL